MLPVRHRAATASLLPVPLRAQVPQRLSHAGDVAYIDTGPPQQAIRPSKAVASSVEHRALDDHVQWPPSPRDPEE